MPARSNAAASRIGESGWTLRSLGALYNETYDDKWLQSADHIVDHFEQWKNKYGAWLAPAAGHWYTVLAS